MDVSSANSCSAIGLTVQKKHKMFRHNKF